MKPATINTAVRRIRHMSDKRARSLGLTVIPPERFLYEREAEARFMDYPRAIVKISAINTGGVRQLELLKQKAMLELLLKIDGADHEREEREGREARLPDDAA